MGSGGRKMETTVLEQQLKKMFYNMNDLEYENLPIGKKNKKLKKILSPASLLGMTQT